MSKEHLSFYIKKKKVTEETELNVYSTSYLVSEGRGESCQQVWGGTTHTSVHAHQESRREEGASLGQGSRLPWEPWWSLLFMSVLEIVGHSVCQLQKVGQPPAWMSALCAAPAVAFKTTELRNTSKYGCVYMGKPVCLKYYPSLQGWELFLENYICWWELF